MNFQPLHNPKDVDLSQHGLIEASAGTGKTYTLENLIVRLLMENQVESIREVLIVTFTEKATSELKARVRKKLEEVLREDELEPLARQRLLISLDMFDEAGIHTIHGFCSRVLKDFAYENQELFLNETIADEKDFAREASADVLRDFMANASLDVLEILAVFGFKAEDLLSRLTEFAQKVWVNQKGELFEASDGILLSDQKITHQTGKPDFQKLLKSLKQTLGDLRIASYEIWESYLRWADAGFPADWEDARSWGVRFTKSGQIHGADLKARVKLLPQARLLQEEPQSSEEKTAREIRILQFAASLCVESCRQENAVAEKLEALVEMRWHLVSSLGLEAGGGLRQKLEREGRISFDGLLRKILEALEGSRSELLKSRIRTRWPIALVDEFQDTDPLQWEIFSRIWLEGNSRNRLYLIGDPKQAIYAFRGADVFTYLKARDAMHERARVYSLGTNYRSHPDLVRFFNRVFEREVWFGQDRAGRGIRHEEIKAGKEIPELIEADESGRGAVSAVMVDSVGGWAQRIATEIRMLVESQTIRIPTDEGSRFLNYGDCAVLIYSRSTAFEALKGAFLKERIPWSSYRSPGLYQSVEAESFRLLLRALAMGDEGDYRTLLSSPWFGLNPDTSQYHDALNPEHPLRFQMARWREMGLRRQIPAMLYQILETAPLYDACLRRKEQYFWERRQTNFAQIGEVLALQASRRPYTLTDLSVWLDRVCLGLLDAEEESRDCMRQDTEDPRVSVLTMHVSKGLEFPVVFLLPGKKENTRFDMGTRVHLEDQSAWLGYSKDARELFSKEQSEERLRLLYVAMTRARLKLYWPLYEGPSGVIGPALQDAAQVEGVEIMQEEFPRLVSKVGRNEVLASEAEDPFLREDFGEQSQSEFQIRRRKIERTSFSGMLRHLDGSSFQFGEEEGRDDEVMEEADPEEALPRGKGFGNLVHSLFEHLDWDQIDQRVHFSEEAFLQLALRHELDPSIRPQVENMVSSVMKAPLIGPLEGIRLMDIPSTSVLREPDFSTGFPELAHLKGYLEGAIDLIFEHENRFYVADWKTNFLNSYSRKSMNQAMAHAGYELQARIYALAVTRWLSTLFGDEGPKHFGGVYYFFVRGMQKPGEGVWYLPPENVPSRILEEQIGRELQRMYEGMGIV